MRNIFLQFFSDFLEVAVTLMSLGYWYRSFPHGWLHYRNFHFLMLGQCYKSFELHPGNILNYAEPFSSIWLNCLRLIPFGMLSPKITVYFFSLHSSCCYSCCVRCLPRGNFLICKNCLFFWMIVKNHLRTASWFWHHWLISTEICIFWERGKLVFCWRFISAVKRLEFILQLKIHWFFRVS